MELRLSDHMRGLDPSQGRLGRMEGLEAKHGARDPLHEAMVLFDDIVEVFDLQGECPIFCVTGIWSMLPERSKDDDNFQGTAGRALPSCLSLLTWVQVGP